MSKRNNCVAPKILVVVTTTVSVFTTPVGPSSRKLPRGRAGFEERAAKLEADIANTRKRGKELESKVGAPFEHVQHFGNLLNELWEFMNNGIYPFMLFACVCFAAISWLFFRKRKSPPPIPNSAQTRAIVGSMLASPGMYSDADGGRTRLIMGDVPSRRINDFGSNLP